MYFLKQKYEVYEIFKVFKDLVDNLSGNIIKVLRTDNGNEYFNNNLHHLCEHNNIQFLPHHNKMVWQSARIEH